jgi:chemotaxis protein MotB
MASPKKEEPKKGAPEWMNTYGDMVTLMLTFFVMLFSMSSLDVAKFEALAESYSGKDIIVAGSMGNMMTKTGGGLMDNQAAPEEVQSDNPTEAEEEEFAGTAEEILAGRDKLEDHRELNEMASDFKTYFAQYTETSAIAVDVNDPYLDFMFPDYLLFDPGEATLKPSALPALDHFAAMMQRYPDYNIRIEGHTDNVPMSPTNRYRTNWLLSAARAISVLEYLETEKGFSSEILSAEGLSEYHPIASNDTPEGRSQNRRVIIRVYKYNPTEIEYIIE